MHGWSETEPLCAANHRQSYNGRRALRTTVENPADSALAITVTLNGTPVTVTIAPNTSAVVENAIPAGVTSIVLGFRGDRRLVLLETDFQ